MNIYTIAFIITDKPLMRLNVVFPIKNKARMDK